MPSVRVITLALGAVLLVMLVVVQARHSQQQQHQLRAESHAATDSEAADAGSSNAETDSEADAGAESLAKAEADLLVLEAAQFHLKAEAAALQRGDDDAADADADADYPHCQTCTHILDRILDGTGKSFGHGFGANSYSLPHICNDLWKSKPDEYAACHQVLDAVRHNGRGVHYWITHGCYEKYIYQRTHHIVPCPFPVICSVLRDFKLKPFCPSEKKVSQYGLKSVNKASGNI